MCMCDLSSALTTGITKGHGEVKKGRGHPKSIQRNGKGDPSNKHSLTERGCFVWGGPKRKCCCIVTNAMMGRFRIQFVCDSLLGVFIYRSLIKKFFFIFLVNETQPKRTMPPTFEADPGQRRYSTTLYSP